MKKARMNISHFRFILFNLKIFGEIVTTNSKSNPNPNDNFKKQKRVKEQMSTQSLHLILFMGVT